jgi:ABC-type nitrate/sulfonate/bicarbonate transport system ATPase subunit
VTLDAPVIEIRHVGKRYWQGRRGGLLALQDVNLDIKQEEFVSIIGASGCGKTTLLRMLAGLTTYDTGEILLRGEPVREVPKRIGFVFQSPALLPWKSVAENVALGLTPLPGLSSSERKARVERQIDVTGLRGFDKYLPHQLSGGMQQRVGLARALVGEPDVLLMDEPLGALDAFTRRRLQEELASIVARTSATSVFVTHDVDEAIFLSDRVVVLASGPGQVKEIITVELPRPRTHAGLLGDSRVSAIRDRILALVTEAGTPVAANVQHPVAG